MSVLSILSQAYASLEAETCLIREDPTKTVVQTQAEVTNVRSGPRVTSPYLFTVLLPGLMFNLLAYTARPSVVT